ncbi:hypothetical protein SAMN04487785_109148 [Dyella jiangningensis]|uniref:hypothetical protein n=1 Tax=Dyella sp. AtDHG13 TaxID=1938897 RepID=UPI00088B1449|nr:hypothetical protein [Dyella sp. AtDHG13]PXV57024.1 hypothetical protein BDW41_108146 [Dyella sp. AtDHG13]SDK64501.1 hypothetical protein SAMN04487785_109148 [Dyella jiangningensis]
MAGQGNLVLGMATGYAAKDLRPFVQSLAMTGFQGRLALFVYKDQCEPIRAMAQTHAPSLELDLVVVDGIRRYAKFWRSCFKRLFAMMPAEASPALKRRMLRFQGMPHITRHFHYDDYLRTHPGFDHVMLTDVRDVVFQAEPFERYEGGLSVGMEIESLTLAGESYNRKWILGAYGEDMLQRIGARQISCAGVVIGDARSMREYIDKMLAEIMRLPFRITKTANYDQAHHNKLLYCDELSMPRLCQPLSSRIATVGCMQPADFSLSPDGLLLNEDRQVAPIVHQYDRHPLLVDAFMARILT